MSPAVPVAVGIAVGGAALVIFAVLFIGGVWVLAHGARVWAEAVGALHQARYQGVQANVAAAADDAAQALDEERDERARSRAPFVPPTDDELAALLLEERVLGRRGKDAEYTTLGNEGIEETTPIPEGGMYRESSVGR